MQEQKKVAVIMGSDSDWPVVKGACLYVYLFGVPYEARILSAHRTPEAAAAFAKNARANGYGVILCAAGMAAHLAGAFAANTTLPVVGIPMKGGAMDGLDALLATVQMPSGFPVATVALNGAKKRGVPGRVHPGCGRRSPGGQARRFPRRYRRRHRQEGRRHFCRGRRAVTQIFLPAELASPPQTGYNIK